MKSHRFGSRSKSHLSRLDPQLARVVERALELSDYDFGLVCSTRTDEEQLELLAKGLTTTLNSKHLKNAEGKSEAIDILVYDGKGKPTYKRPYYSKVAKAMFKAAIELQVQIEWGGHWFSLFDGPHFELSK